MKHCSYCRAEVPNDQAWASKTQWDVWWCKDEEACLGRTSLRLLADKKKREQEALA